MQGASKTRFFFPSFCTSSGRKKKKLQSFSEMLASLELAVRSEALTVVLCSPEVPWGWGG